MIAVQKGQGLLDEFRTWWEVRHRMNGASWYDATYHSIKLTGATDASSSVWGGIVRDLSSLLVSSRQPQISQRNG